MAAASNRPVLGEKAADYAKALKEGGCDKVEDLMLFDRPFYESVGMRYADVTQWLLVLKQADEAAATEEMDEEFAV